MLEIIKKEQPQFKANLHCHSTLSDGRLTPGELKKAYKDRGYSVLCISDHEYPKCHTDLSDEDFVMLTGYEAYIRPSETGTFSQYGTEVHINLFARDPENVSYVCYDPVYCKYVKDPAIKDGFKKVGSSEPREYTVEYINRFVRTAKEHGYICSYNHPYWSMEDWSRIEAYEGFFSMEMCNYSSHVTNGLEYNGQLYENLLRRGKPIFCHSADDNHNVLPLDHVRSDSFGGFAYIMAQELSYDSIFAALERGDFYSSMGPRIHSLYIEDGKAYIETDPVKQIVMHYGGKKPKIVMDDRTSPVTRAELEIDPKAPFVRFTATDFEGRSADTRGIFAREFR